ncbi:hypothetical protein [Legionella sp. W05-934-2]|uniref:hypothetical protein n=1 Tax=Legionella sp. W05-934-2 TaxID=1198649 RepID=UPI00346366B6
MFSKIIQTYWRVCRLQISPAKTPNNTLLTGLLVIGYVLVKLGLVAVIPKVAVDQSMTMIRQLIITTISMLGYTYLILYSQSMSNRFIRTINCLFACAILIEVMTIPIFLILPTPPADPSATVTGAVAIAQLTAFFALFIFAVWQIVVNVYIYQQSLSISQGRAFLVWLGLIATQMSLFFIGGMI